jgi:hypothetical protein
MKLKNSLFDSSSTPFLGKEELPFELELIRISNVLIDVQLI